MFVIIKMMKQRICVPHCFIKFSMKKWIVYLFTDKTVITEIRVWYTMLCNWNLWLRERNKKRERERWGSCAEVNKLVNKEERGRESPFFEFSLFFPKRKSWIFFINFFGKLIIFFFCLVFLWRQSNSHFWT